MRSFLLSPFWVLTLIITLSACSPSSIVTGLLSGGGPNVAANTQVGKTNTQAVVSQVAPTVTLRPESRVDTIDQRQTTNNELPNWVWVALIMALIIGWVTDTPATYLKRYRNK